MVFGLLKGALAVVAVAVAVIGVLGIVALSRGQNDVMSVGERLFAVIGAIFIVAMAANALY